MYKKGLVKAMKISQVQLFVLMVTFELGSAIVVGVGTDAKQDAWMAIFLGMFIGIFIFLLYGYMYKKFPETPLSVYLEKVVGKFLGKTLGFIYLSYFFYISSRVLRDFGELITTGLLQDTPIMVVNSLMMIVIVYGCFKGLEVIARTGEILFYILGLFTFILYVLIFISVDLKPENLQPTLENGLAPVLSTVFPETITIPFGELIVFTMLLPYVKKQKGTLKTGILAILFSGLVLSLTMTINIMTLGVDQLNRTLFPLLDTIEKVSIGGFLERIDPIAVVIMVIGGFFKIIIFFYAGLLGIRYTVTSNYQKPIIIIAAISVVFLSKVIAGNWLKHIQIGLEVVPTYIHIPLQVIIPGILALLTIIMKRKWSKNKGEA
ncbi:GerAB/ArcD/ProY family transporter [Salinibacillus xinjiangensis]|uniref:GerAB/ArcD/ProY family transporter n=1 Tax=Salinibacillus xinjiangensis TaxID=1229268 RepID=A0A6G1X2P7_9BACI|nr:GerAB/ArcD/ProY family transporter [Salinibacillus xinjiangensis]MRG85267.1 GerAB/ArcD/ProY family transporter [Salinibacillus xinjiangensis]